MRPRNTNGFGPFRPPGDGIRSVAVVASAPIEVRSTSQSANERWTSVTTTGRSSTVYAPLTHRTRQISWQLAGSTPLPSYES